MSDIPAARTQLMDLATDVGGEIGTRISAIVGTLLYRESNVRRAPAKHRAVTARLRDTIKAYERANPRMHLSEIGSAFGVNQGRVSEILTGKWDHL